MAEVKRRRKTAVAGIAPSEPDGEIVAESFQATPAASTPSNEGDEPAPLTPHDSPNSAHVETEQKAENARAESASSK